MNDLEGNTLIEVFGEVLHSYARAQAIEDGVLVDVSELAKQAGIIYPTCMTIAVWNNYVDVPDELKHEQDENGRIWDLVCMLRWAIRIERIKGTMGYFSLIVRTPESTPWQTNEKRYGHNQRLVTLKSICGPGDIAEPVVSILMPFED